jgi:hypothetical protein
MSKVLTFKERVKAFINSDDDAVITTTMLRTEVYCNKQIKNGKQAIDNIKFKADTAIDELKDRLVDAKLELEDSYNAYDVSVGKSNSAVDAFIVETYLPTINAAFVNVATIEASIKEAEETRKSAIASKEAEIATFQRLLDKLAEVVTIED